MTPGGQLVTSLVAPTGEVRTDLPGKVSVLVRAFGPGGTPVSGLEAIDFQLAENGVPVSPTESQQQFLPRPKAYRSYSHLLLDLSSSIASNPGALQAEIDAAKAYVEVVAQDPASFIAISWFFGIADIVPGEVFQSLGGFPVLTPLGFSNDKAKLFQALDNATQVEVFDDSTNLYGAIIAAAGVLDDAALDAVASGQIEFVSKALVTFTDGSHNANGLTLESAVAALGPDLEAFSIGVGNEINTNALKALGPDGSSFASNLSGLADAFQEVASSLANAANSYYLVGYISPKNDGSGPQELSIQVAGVDGATPVVLDFQTDYFSAGGGFVASIDGPTLSTSSRLIDLVVGQEALIPGDNPVYVLARPLQGAGISLLGFDANGVPLADFGSGGRLEIAPGPSYTALEPRALAYDANNGTLYAGTLATPSNGSPQEAVVWRVTAGGSLSQLSLPHTGSFGEIERIEDLWVDSLGRLLVAGGAGPLVGEARRKVCYRLLPNFTLDSAFGFGGVFVHGTAPSGSGDNAYGVTSVPAGTGERTYLVGRGWNPARGALDAQFLALDETGKLDPDFQGTGVLCSWGPFQSAISGGLGSARRARVDAFGRLVVAGTLAPPGNPGTVFLPTIWRMLPNGSPDPSLVGGSSNPFKPTGATPGVGLVSLGGVLTSNPALLFGLGAEVVDLALGPGGAILVAGNRANPEGHQDACWWRFSQSGLLSNAFNGTGFFIEDGTFSDNGVETLSALAIHPDGRILSAGWAKINPQTSESRPLLFFDADPRRAF